MTDSVAQDQIVAFVDRILRMKEEKRAIQDDIREIYAEAKGNGLDKTVLGKLVNYVEKRATDAAALAEGEAVFDLYLSAYLSAKGQVGTRIATHTHEADYDDDITAEAVQIMRDRAAPALAAADFTQSDLAETRPDGRGEAESASGEAPDTAPHHFQAKASEGKASTAPLIEAPLDGEASRPSRGGDTPAPNSSVAASAPAVRAERHNDDPRCLDKAKCGAMSNFAFCIKCRAAWRERHPLEAA